MLHTVACLLCYARRTQPSLLSENPTQKCGLSDDGGGGGDGEGSGFFFKSERIKWRKKTE